jgi:hypothetical protein
MSVFADKGVTSGIMFSLATKPMRLTIDFDGQSQGRTIEIHDIGPDAVLPAKLHAQLLSAQLLPEQDLRERHLLAQTPSHDRYRLQRAWRRPSGAARHLPGPGRIGSGAHPYHPNNRSFTTLPPCVRRMALPISSSSTGAPISLSQKALRKL